MISKTMATIILLATMLVPVVSLAASEVTFEAAATQIDKNLRNKVSGTVHLYPATKGPEIKTLENGMIDLDPLHIGKSRAESLYYCKPDLIEAINTRVADTLRQAGYTVTIGKDAPANADIKVRLQLTRALVGRSYELIIPQGTPTTEGQQVLFQETQRPQALLWVTAELENKEGKKVPSFILSEKIQLMVTDFLIGLKLERPLNAVLELLQTDALYTVYNFQVAPKVVEDQAAKRQDMLNAYLAKEKDLWIHPEQKR